MRICVTGNLLMPKIVMKEIKIKLKKEILI
jgi:hypothetical protein